MVTTTTPPPVRYRSPIEKIKKPEARELCRPKHTLNAVVEYNIIVNYYGFSKPHLFCKAAEG